MARRSKASAQSTTRAERAAVVMEKKGKGWSFQKIADFLLITKQAAHTIYWEERAKWLELKHGHSEEIDAERDDDLEIHRQILEAWLPEATGTAVDEDGKPLPKCRHAAGVVQKTLSERAKLLGTYAPVRNDITSNGETLKSSGADLSSYSAEELAQLELIHRQAAARKADSDGPAASA